MKIVQILRGSTAERDRESAYSVLLLNFIEQQYALVRLHEKSSTTV